MPVNKLANGRFQASYADKKRGIPRTKRTFDTSKEAKEWLAALKDEGHKRLLGIRGQRLFGEALAKFIAEHRHLPAECDRLIGMGAALRWPYQDGKQWMRMEQLPLEEVEAGLHAWIVDLQAVTRRRYLDGRTYLQRRENGALVWYEQPAPESAPIPPVRVRVTSEILLERLAKNQPDGAQGGRGPFASQTLRYRQIIAKKVLKQAYRPWRWTDEDFGANVQLMKPAGASENWLLPAQLHKLHEMAPDWFDRAIRGAAWIGWRKKNVLALEWPRVSWPVRDADGELIQAGVIWVAADKSKNRGAISQPMSDRVEALLLECWEHRNGKYVFHDGEGVSLAEVDFKRRWATLKRAAGIPRNFRWHDLRHTWASHLTIGGTPSKQLQSLGGWKTPAMPSRYSHLNVGYLMSAVQSYKLVDQAARPQKNKLSPVPPES